MDVPVKHVNRLPWSSRIETTESDFMPRIVECVPNFSEGRRPEIIDEICAAMTAHANVSLLGKEMDSDHNRSVVTLAGDPANMVAAVFDGVKKASELIDLNGHQGEHPRMGATDVIPFVPIEGITMDECVGLAQELGKRMGDELGIPVFLYERAATRPERENLAEVRKGEFEGLRDGIPVDETRIPDFGPRAVHPTAGATAVGAREFLVAFNVNLGTDNVSIAKKIARAVRWQTGGYRFCKALGFSIRERGIVQVSMNMVNYKKTPLHRVFDTIVSEARRHGVAVIESEIVGLVPNDALIRSANHHLCMFSDFKADQILENRLRSVESEPDNSLTPFLDRLASNSPAPGGGSASAASGATAAALVSMVCNLTVGKRKFKDVADELRDLRGRSEELRRKLTTAIEEDAAAFDAMMAARKLPKESEEEQALRAEAVERATLGGIEVPLQVMRHAGAVMELARIVVEKGNPNCLSDGGVAALHCMTALQGAFYNVMINLPGLRDQERALHCSKEGRELLRSGRKLADEIHELVEAKLGA